VKSSVCIGLLVMMSALSLRQTYAQTTVTNQTLVLNCLASVGDETSWPECRGMIFLPCEEHTAGTTVHLSCLLKQKTDWENRMADTQENLLEELTPEGNSMLAALMSQWGVFRDSRCDGVANSQPGGERPARLGCEIMEIAALTAEFEACLAGRSQTSYCMLRQ